jgi:hypothetical protein
MILRKISAQNLKGRTFEHELSKAVAVIGPNFSGKTAIVEAIRLAGIGYIPEVGKKTQATWELSSDAEMTVAAEFSDGEVIRRRFFMKGPTISVENDGIGFDLPLLDPEHYFGLTDSQRTDYVFERIRLPETYSIESVWADLKRLNLGEKHSEAVEIAHRDILDDIGKWFAPKSVVQDALGNALEALREKFTYWNRRAKETQGAVATLTELKVRETNVKAAPANLGADIAQAQKDLAAINQEIGKLTADRDAAERNAGRRKMLQKELDKDRIDYPRMLAQKQEEKVALEKKLVPEPNPEDIEAARRTIASANSTIRGADNAVNVADTDIGAVDTRLKEVAKLKECPYCKTKGTDWKATLRAELLTRKTKAEDDITAAGKLRDKASEDLRDATESLEEMLRAQESNHRLREEIRQLEREIGNLQTDQRAETEKRERYQGEIKELKAGDVGKLNQSIAFAEEKRKGASSRLAELEETRTAEARLQQDLLRATEAEKEHQIAKAHTVLIKAIADLLKDKRESIIAEAFNKLLQVANMVVKSILKSPLVLHENTIGRFAGAKFVPHRVFSGTEKALTYIAIATALSIDAPFKLVLLDEFGRLDSANQATVIARLTHLVNEGVIDQFIVVGTEIPKAALTTSQLQVIHVAP